MTETTIDTQARVAPGSVPGVAGSLLLHIILLALTAGLISLFRPAQAIFSEYGRELPALTQAIIAFSDNTVVLLALAITGVFFFVLDAAVLIFLARAGHQRRVKVWSFIVTVSALLCSGVLAIALILPSIS